MLQPQKEKVPIFIPCCCCISCSTTSVTDDKNKLRVRWTYVCLNLNGALHVRNQHDLLEHLITSVSGQLGLWNHSNVLKQLINSCYWYTLVILCLGFFEQLRNEIIVVKECEDGKNVKMGRKPRNLKFSLVENHEGRNAIVITTVSNSVVWQNEAVWIS